MSRRDISGTKRRGRSTSATRSVHSSTSKDSKASRRSKSSTGSRRRHPAYETPTPVLALGALVDGIYTANYDRVSEANQLVWKSMNSTRGDDSSSDDETESEEDTVNGQSMIYDASPVPSVMRTAAGIRAREGNGDRYANKKYRDGMKANEGSRERASRRSKERADCKKTKTKTDHGYKRKSFRNNRSSTDGRETIEGGNYKKVTPKKNRRTNMLETAEEKDHLSMATSIDSDDSFRNQHRGSGKDRRKGRFVGPTESMDSDSSEEQRRTNVKSNACFEESDGDAGFDISTAFGGVFDGVKCMFDTAWRSISLDDSDDDSDDGSEVLVRYESHSDSESESGSKPDEQSFVTASLYENTIDNPPKALERDRSDMTHKSMMLKQQMELLALQSQVIDRLIEEKKEDEEERSQRSLQSQSQKAQPKSKFNVLKKFGFSKKSKKSKDEQPERTITGSSSNDERSQASRVSRTSQASSVEIARELKAKIEETMVANEKLLRPKIPTCIDTEQPPRHDRGRPPLPPKRIHHENKFSYERSGSQKDERAQSHSPLPSVPSTSPGTERNEFFSTDNTALKPQTSRKHAKSAGTISRVVAQRKIPVGVNPNKNKSQQEENKGLFGMLRRKQSTNNVRAQIIPVDSPDQISQEEAVETKNQTRQVKPANTNQELEDKNKDGSQKELDSVQQRDSRDEASVGVATNDVPAQQQERSSISKQNNSEKRDGIEVARSSTNESQKSHVDPPGNMSRATSRRVKAERTDEGKVKEVRLPAKEELPSRNTTKPVDKKPVRASRVSRSFQPKKASNCRLEDFPLNRPSPNLEHNAERNLAVIENPEIELCLSETSAPPAKGSGSGSWRPWDRDV